MRVQYLKLIGINSYIYKYMLCEYFQNIKKKNQFTRIYCFQRTIIDKLMQACPD